MDKVMYFELSFGEGEANTFNMVITATKHPTLEEVNEWCAEDVKMFGPITSLNEIDLETAKRDYDFSDNEMKPIFPIH